MLGEAEANTNRHKQHTEMFYFLWAFIEAKDLWHEPFALVGAINLIIIFVALPAYLNRRRCWCAAEDEEKRTNNTRLLIATLATL